MFTRTWLVVLLGAAISVIVNSACAGFLSGVGLIFLSSILFPPFYNKLQVHSSIMIGRDKNGKLKWRDQGVSGSDFLFPNTSCFYLFLPPGSPCLSILLLGLSGRFFLKSALGGRRWSRKNSKGWGLSAKLGKHSAIWGKLGTAPQTYTLNPCTRFPPNPTSRKVNT